MNQKRLEWKVGLFVVACLVLLGLLVVNFSKGLTFFTPTYTLRLKTSNVGGIKREAAVLVAGVPVGNVAGAELSPDGRTVTVLLKILARYQIHGDAVFTIDSMGFLGDQYVAILAGKNEAPVLKDGDEVICREPFNLQEVARSALGFIQRIDETARKLDSALARVVQANTFPVSATASNLALFSRQLNDLAADLQQVWRTNKTEFATAVKNIE